MTDKKPELSDAMKKKLEPKKFTKNPNNRTNITKNLQMIRYIRMLLNIEFSLYDTETFGRKFFPKY